MSGYNKEQVVQKEGKVGLTQEKKTEEKAYSDPGAFEDTDQFLISGKAEDEALLMQKPKQPLNPNAASFTPRKS